MARNDPIKDMHSLQEMACAANFCGVKPGGSFTYALIHASCMSCSAKRDQTFTYSTPSIMRLTLSFVIAPVRRTLGVGRCTGSQGVCCKEELRSRTLVGHRYCQLLECMHICYLINLQRRH